MSLSITPVTDFPPAVPDVFPGGIQWQLSGIDIGTREVDTVNLVAGDALAMEVDPLDPKRITITIPSGA